MVALNATAPNFTLRSTSGHDVSLKDFRGKTVILAFFPAAFTGVCQNQICAFNDELSRLNEANATVFGISVDGPHALGAFAKQNSLNFELLSDLNKEAVTAFDITFPNFANIEGYTVAKRSAFVINSEGQIIYRWIAPNPGVEPNYAEVIAAAESL